MAIGNKNLLAITFILQAAAFFWILYIRESWTLYILAAIFGIACGSGIPQQSPFVARVFGVRSLGLILGIVSLKFSLSFFTGPLEAQ
jgi:hypothetical protein